MPVPNEISLMSSISTGKNNLSIFNFCGVVIGLTESNKRRDTSRGQTYNAWKKVYRVLEPKIN